MKNSYFRIDGQVYCSFLSTKTNVEYQARLLTFYMIVIVFLLGKIRGGMQGDDEVLKNCITVYLSRNDMFNAHILAVI